MKLFCRSHPISLVAQFTLGKQHSQKGVSAAPPMLLQLWKRGEDPLHRFLKSQKGTSTTLRWSIAGEKSSLANSIQMQAGTIWGNLQTGFGEFFFQFLMVKDAPILPLLSPVYFVTKISKCAFFCMDEKLCQPVHMI